MFGFRRIIGEYRKGSHLWRNIKRTLLKLSTPKAFFFVVKEKYVVSCFKVNVFLFWLTTSLDDSRFVRSRCERIPYMVVKGKLDDQKQWTRSERKLNSFQLLLSFCKLWLVLQKKLKAYVRMILHYPKPPLLLIRVIFLWLWALDGAFKISTAYFRRKKKKRKTGQKKRTKE